MITIISIITGINIFFRSKLYYYFIDNIDPVLTVGYNNVLESLH
jgi:hypothetical protein